MIAGELNYSYIGRHIIDPRDGSIWEISMITFARKGKVSIRASFEREGTHNRQHTFVFHETDSIPLAG